MDEIKCANKTRAAVYLKPGESIDSAFRRLKRKMETEKVMEEFFYHSDYVKPCIAKRRREKKR